jgi:hypothetical protein
MKRGRESGSGATNRTLLPITLGTIDRVRSRRCIAGLLPVGRPAARRFYARLLSRK